MKEINVLPQGYRAFTAIWNDIVLGRVEYPKWYSSKAVISIGEEAVYTLEPKGFWQTTQELKKDGVLILEMQMKWSGKILISKPKDADRSYAFQPKGFFKNGYVLTDYKGNEFFHIRSDFSWKKFNAGFIITCKDDFGNDEFEQLLMLMSVYYFKAMQDAAASGTV
jgi:hypothetical protein